MSSEIGQQQAHSNDGLLYVENLTKQFGGITALDSITMGCADDEIVGVIGPNGAGKSTLFNSICGVIKPDNGSVYLNGTVITGRPPHEIASTGIARTFQTPRPLESLSVLENVMAGAHIRTKDRAEAMKIASKQLSVVGLENKAKVKAHEINISETKSMELARALAIDPDLVLIDELLAGLPRGESAGLLNLIKDLGSERGVIVIEHDIESIMEVSERLIVLHQGQIIADGRPSDVANDEYVNEVYLG